MLILLLTLLHLAASCGVLYSLWVSLRFARRRIAQLERDLLECRPPVPSGICCPITPPARHR